MKKWYFNSVNICSNYKFNQSMEDFNKYGIAGVIRENIQNSTDAKLDKNHPVQIDIKLETIETNNIPGIDCLKKRISSLKGQNTYTNNTISHMQSTIKSEKCRIMTIEDSNTKGLTGATEHNSPYIAYAYSKGFHAEDKNNEIEAERGGSHGIGKIASNASSDIATMYFATKDDQNKMYLGGTCEFIDHNYDNKNFLGTGYFAEFKENKFIPYSNTADNDIFSKTTRGLKVIIPFLKEEFFNSNEIIKSICDSFFVSIFNNQLVANICGEKLNKDSLENYILNSKYYLQNIKDYNRNSSLTALYYQTFKNEKNSEITILDKDNNEYQFLLYLSCVNNLKIGKYCIFRTNGMKISEKSIKGYASSNFNIVLIAKGVKENLFLKALENESHTQLSVDHIRDKISRQNANRFLNNLDNKISEIVAKKLEELNPTDGKIDTSDIIYEMTYTFKKIEKEKNSIIKISESSESNSKKESLKNEVEDITLIKTSTGDYDISETGEMKVKVQNSRTNGSLNQTTNSNPSFTDKDINKKIPSKRTIIKEINGKENKFIKLASGSVKRKFINNYEKLLLDLSGITEIKSISKCSLKLSVIDGEGALLTDFLISDNYEQIKQENSILNISFDKKEIKGITIKDNKIKLDMKLTNNYNKNLKFIYEVVI